VSNLVHAGQAHVLASIGKELGRAENTVLFAKKSWYEKNHETAQRLTEAIAKAQLWLKAASDEQIARTVAPYFPGTPLEISTAVVRRYRETRAPLWSESPVIDRQGLAKLEEVIVLGGVMAPEKIVPYEAIVAPEATSDVARPLAPK
jgi:NitT/TauT family transport system substrate-binding protein